MDPTTRYYLLLKLAETLGVIAVMMIAGTGGGMVFRPVEFKYPKREARVSLIVYILALGLAVLIYCTGFDLNLPIAAETGLTQRLLLAILTLGVAAAALFIRRQPLLSAGWGGRQNLRLGLRTGLMLVFLTIFLRGKLTAIVNGISGGEGIELLLLIGICLAEETVFRGYLQLRVNSWLGTPRGWMLVSALFVLWQLPRLLLAPVTLWIDLPVLVIQSFLLGWMMQKTGHVIAPALYRIISEWITFLA